MYAARTLADVARADVARADVVAKFEVEAKGDLTVFRDQGVCPSIL
jgi:hypothetical protein